MHRAGYPGEAAAMQPGPALGLALRYGLHVGGALALNPRRLWIQLRGLRRRSPASSARGGGSSGGGGGANANGHAPSREPSSGQATAPPAADDQREGVDHGAASANGTGTLAPRRAAVFGLPCVDTEPAAAARDLVRWAKAQVGRRVAFVNAHSVNVSAHDRAFKQVLERADVIYADGIGMAMAARLHGTRLQHNVNGTDLFPYLCREAESAGVGLALLGAAPGVVDDCEQVLAARYPDLRIAWKHHGYVADEDYPALVEDINASGAGILLVAMGVPRQEQWIMEHWDRLTVPVVMGVGGLFDFVSGRMPRAPEPVRRLRLEWLFRLAMEPRRLFGRYVLGNPVFLARACRYALTGHVGSRERQRVAPR
jgi:N-acetylglucosaminyldiphosphoundecaprenol N-acetyl-beta-D-mannosaminyltransferase